MSALAIAEVPRPATPTPPPCVHCKQYRKLKRRGLCWMCYDLPSVREQYPRLKESLGSGEEFDFYGEVPLPPKATNALPGSQEKMRILCERVRLKQALFHPRDARATDNAPLLFETYERMRVVDETLRSQALRRAGKVKRKRRLRPNRIRGKQLQWRRWVCCLFGAATRGQCGCPLAEYKHDSDPRYVATTLADVDQGEDLTASTGRAGRGAGMFGEFTEH